MINDKLQIDLYDASDGLRLLIYGSNDTDFSNVQNLFLRLAREQNLGIKLHLQEYVNFIRPTEIVLFNSVHQKRIRKGIHHVEENRIDWFYDSDNWKNLVELVDTIVNSPIACHQYLNLYPHDDLKVVLSKGEYPVQ